MATANHLSDSGDADVKAIMKIYQHPEILALKKKYDRADLNGDGSLSALEFAQCFRILFPLEPGQKAANSRNQHGRVQSFKEVVSPEEMAVAMEMFRKLDVDKSDNISFYEYLAWHCLNNPKVYVPKVLEKLEEQWAAEHGAKKGNSSSKSSNSNSNSNNNSSSSSNGSISSKDDFIRQGIEAHIKDNFISYKEMADMQVKAREEKTKSNISAVAQRVLQLITNHFREEVGSGVDEQQDKELLDLIYNANTSRGCPMWEAAVKILKDSKIPTQSCDTNLAKQIKFESPAVFITALKLLQMNPEERKQKIKSGAISGPLGEYMMDFNETSLLTTSRVRNLTQIINIISNSTLFFNNDVELSTRDVEELHDLLNSPTFNTRMHGDRMSLLISTVASRARVLANMGICITQRAHVLSTLRILSMEARVGSLIVKRGKTDNSYLRLPRDLLLDLDKVLDGAPIVIREEPDDVQDLRGLHHLLFTGPLCSPDAKLSLEELAKALDQAIKVQQLRARRKRQVLPVVAVHLKRAVNTTNKKFESAAHVIRAIQLLGADDCEPAEVDAPELGMGKEVVVIGLDDISGINKDKDGNVLSSATGAPSSSGANIFSPASQAQMGEQLTILTPDQLANFINNHQLCEVKLEGRDLADAVTSVTRRLRAVMFSGAVPVYAAALKAMAKHKLKLPSFKHLLDVLQVVAPSACGSRNDYRGANRRRSSLAHAEQFMTMVRARMVSDTEGLITEEGTEADTQVTHLMQTIKEHNLCDGATDELEMEEFVELENKRRERARRAQAAIVPTCARFVRQAGQHALVFESPAQFLAALRVYLQAVRGEDVSKSTTLKDLPAKTAQILLKLGEQDKGETIPRPAAFYTSHSPGASSASSSSTASWTRDDDWTCVEVDSLMENVIKTKILKDPSKLDAEEVGRVVVDEARLLRRRQRACRMALPRLIASVRLLAQAGSDVCFTTGKQLVDALTILVCYRGEAETRVAFAGFNSATTKAILALSAGTEEEEAALVAAQAYDILSHPDVYVTCASEEKVEKGEKGEKDKKVISPSPAVKALLAAIPATLIDRLKVDASALELLLSLANRKRNRERRANKAFLPLFAAYVRRMAKYDLVFDSPIKLIQALKILLNDVGKSQAGVEREGFKSREARIMLNIAHVPDDRIITEEGTKDVEDVGHFMRILLKANLTKVALSADAVIKMIMEEDAEKRKPGRKLKVMLPYFTAVILRLSRHPTPLFTSSRQLIKALRVLSANPMADDAERCNLSTEAITQLSLLRSMDDEALVLTELGSSSSSLSSYSAALSSGGGGHSSSNSISSYPNSNHSISSNQNSPSGHHGYTNSLSYAAAGTAAGTATATSTGKDSSLNGVVSSSSSSGSSGSGVGGGEEDDIDKVTDLADAINANSLKIFSLPGVGLDLVEVEEFIKCRRRRQGKILVPLMLAYVRRMQKAGIQFDTPDQMISALQVLTKDERESGSEGGVARGGNGRAHGLPPHVYTSLQNLLQDDDEDLVVSEVGPEEEGIAEVSTITELIQKANFFKGQSLPTSKLWSVDLYLEQEKLKNLRPKKAKLLLLADYYIKDMIFRNQKFESPKQLMKALAILSYNYSEIEVQQTLLRGEFGEDVKDYLGKLAKMDVEELWVQHEQSLMQQSEKSEHDVRTLMEAAKKHALFKSGRVEFNDKDVENLTHLVFRSDKEQRLKGRILNLARKAMDTLAEEKIEFNTPAQLIRALEVIFIEEDVDRMEVFNGTLFGVESARQVRSQVLSDFDDDDEFVYEDVLAILERCAEIVDLEEQGSVEVEEVSDAPKRPSIALKTSSIFPTSDQHEGLGNLPLRRSDSVVGNSGSVPGSPLTQPSRQLHDAQETEGAIIAMQRGYEIRENNQWVRHPGLDIRSHKKSFGIMTYAKSFVGGEALKWLVDYCAHNRIVVLKKTVDNEVGAKFFMSLITQNYVEHVRNKREFKANNNKSLYRFTPKAYFGREMSSTMSTGSAANLPNNNPGNSTPKMPAATKRPSHMAWSR